MRPADTSPEVYALQIELYRQKGPEWRLQAGMELSDFGRRLLEEGIKARHPEYGPREVWLVAGRVWLGDDVLFRAAFPGEPELAP